MKLNTREIERRRKRLGLSVSDISKKLNMSPQGWYDLIESESTKLSTITAIAKLYKCKGRVLVTD
jgi:transcriptional regulator with XRE-family HTH domain